MVVAITTYCVVEIQTDWINYNFYFPLAQKIPTIPGENPYLILWKKREKLSAAYCGSFKKRTIACSAVQLLKNSHESHSAVSHHQILSLLLSMSEQLWARSLVQYLTQVCTTYLTVHVHIMVTYPVRLLQIGQLRGCCCTNYLK